MTVPFSSSSTITTLSEGLSSYLMKTWFSFKIKREHIIICERNFLHFISYYIPFSYYLFISYISFFSSFQKFVSKVFGICLASIIGWRLASLHLYLTLIGEETVGRHSVIFVKADIKKSKEISILMIVGVKVPVSL